MKIDSNKPNIKTKSKVGSMDNVGQGNGQANGHKVKIKNRHYIIYILYNIISKQTVNWFCLVIVLYWLAPLDGVVA